ncbi:MAG: electron-transfer flavoprotein:ubiquinone oxidoreductase [Dehalococcoidales bacterium]|jgi:electron-transferring-flavoprotein dehydrogenase|nr:electron-transfer flavoprotein:ubiquinone oxidoreductase [Dehalococcoidales bacterium]
MNFKKMDVLFVGAGPASLASAIRLKKLLNQSGRKESVVVVEKADKLGQHNLSGAIFEADVLDELIPDWKERNDAFVKKTLGNRVKIDETYFLPRDNVALKLPQPVVPSYIRHKGDSIISISEMVNWLADIAKSLGVEIYTGFAVKEILIKNNVVKGVKLGDKGLNKEGKELSNYTSGDMLETKVTVLGEGSKGLLTEDLVKRFNLADGKNPQIYALGVKEIIRLPQKNNFGANRVVHTNGFPNKTSTPDIFGGGTIYSMSASTIAIALILALDWRYCDLDPQRELQLFKSHSLVKKFLDGGEVVSYGAKIFPVGGFYSIPKLATDGAIIIGDAAGLINTRKLKGLHYAIRSGMTAAEAIFKAISAGDYSRHTLQTHEDLLYESVVISDIRAARNYRQVFAKAGRAGLYLGVPLSLIQQYFPFRLGTKKDHEGMSRARLNRAYSGGIDRLTAVNLSNTRHREDEPSHITFSDSEKCTGCGEEFGYHPCEYFCPAEVYKFEKERLILSPSNCVHCQTCRIKCPHQVIEWQVPEGGDGPRYKMM